jgi:AAA+ superfamily predicted ATPase
MNPSPSISPATTLAVPAAPGVPDWYPPWAREMAELYFSGATCCFILHGNVHDLVRCPTPDGGERFVSLTEFLATQIFGSWEIVMGYDQGVGLRAQAGSDAQRHQEMMRTVSGIIGSPATWSRDPDQVLDLLDRLIHRNLLEEDAAKRKRIALVFNYAQYLIPEGDLSSLARGQAARLVRFMGWAQNPYIKRVNMAFCLIVDKLAELNGRLVQNPHAATIEIPLPSVEERQRFIEIAVGQDGAKKLKSFTPESLALLTNGLNLTNLNVVLSRAVRSEGGLDPQEFRRLKKEIIERQCHGLVEFVEPKHNLDMVVGHEAAKERLRQDAAWISEGRLEAAPMGYLFCGPVGTGKTFMAECYAGSIGIPCVELRNFRSKYVGETEGNLEHVLTVLRSLGPVVVIVDEADAALGNREASGDSGTSGRVFSMIASQMGDTTYRGRIIWMLLTSRPDLLPIDLKRQGRAEVHIPLFYPDDSQEILEMFRIMARKNQAKLADDALPKKVPTTGQLSGADIESIVLAAKRRAMAENRETVERADVQAAVERFIPSAQGLEKEMQELVAVLECTDRAFLPDHWKEQISGPDGRTKLQERLKNIRVLLEDL